MSLYSYCDFSRGKKEEPPCFWGCDIIWVGFLCTGTSSSSALGSCSLWGISRILLVLNSESFFIWKIESLKSLCCLYLLFSHSILTQKTVKIFKIFTLSKGSTKLSIGRTTHKKWPTFVLSSTKKESSHFVPTKCLPVQKGIKEGYSFPSNSRGTKLFWTSHAKSCMTGTLYLELKLLLNHTYHCL